jgi:hypothetical protein
MQCPSYLLSGPTKWNQDFQTNLSLLSLPAKAFSEGLQNKNQNVAKHWSGSMVTTSAASRFVEEKSSNSSAFFLASATTSSGKRANSAM